MRNSLIQIPLNAPLDYHRCGKFEAPSDSWIHEDFDLTDFELILMTDGVLYLEYNHIPFTVHTGEYLLLPPLPAPDNRRKGFKPSDCSFYWIHFSACAPYVLRTLDPESAADASYATPKGYSCTSTDADSVCIPVWGNPPQLCKIDCFNEAAAKQCKR